VDGVTGYLVAPNSAEALDDGVARLVASAEMRRTFGAAARSMVLTRSWSAVCDQLIGHYNEVLASPLTAVPVAAA